MKGKRSQHSDSLRAGQCGVRVPARRKNFYLLQNVRTGSGVHQASNSIGFWGFFLATKQPEREDSHFSIVPKLRMSRAIHLIIMYEFHGGDRHNFLNEIIVFMLECLIIQLLLRLIIRLCIFYFCHNCSIFLKMIPLHQSLNRAFKNVGIRY